MKKTSLFFILLPLFIGFVLSACNNNNQSQSATSAQDTTHNQPKPEVKPGTGIGGTTWSIAICVGDIKGVPISGATVSAPCTGMSPIITDASGKAVFTGSAPCGCDKGQASVSTPKGCDVKFTITCDTTYTVSCSQ